MDALMDLWLNIGLSHLLCLSSVWLGAIVAALLSSRLPGRFTCAAKLILRELWYWQSCWYF